MSARPPSNDTGGEMASSGARFVLLIIASIKDSPSVSALAERAGMSQSTVEVHLAQLKREGNLANDARRGQRPRWRLTSAGSGEVEQTSVRSVPTDTRPPSANEYAKVSSCLRGKMLATTAASVSLDCAETIRLLREKVGTLRRSVRRQRGELARLRPLADAVGPLKAELARLRCDQVTAVMSGNLGHGPAGCPGLADACRPAGAGGADHRLGGRGQRAAG